MEGNDENAPWTTRCVGVEFALIAPVLFMLIFAILGFGIAFMQLQTIRGAVREGARISAVGATVSKFSRRSPTPRPVSFRPGK
jgi:hypothetical protein